MKIPEISPYRAIGHALGITCHLDHPVTQELPHEFARNLFTANDFHVEAPTLAVCVEKGYMTIEIPEKNPWNITNYRVTLEGMNYFIDTYETIKQPA